MIAVDTSSDGRWSPHRAGRIVATLMAAAMVFVLLPISEASAERIQYDTALGDIEDGATAEFSEQPVQGHAMVVVTSHGSQNHGEYAEIDGDGWTEVMNEKEGYRGMAIWVKVAGVNEPQEVSVEWEGSGSDDVHLIIQEFEGNYRFDVGASNSTDFGDQTDEMHTGETDESSMTADSVLVVAAVNHRYDDQEDEADWQNVNLENNIQSNNLQTAYTTSTQTRTWESTAHLDPEDYANAGIAVFAASDWNFDSYCVNEEVHHEVDYDEGECVLDAPTDNWEDGVENPESVRVLGEQGTNYTEEIPHVSDASQIEIGNEDCSSDHVCHAGGSSDGDGYCRERDAFNGCERDSHCESDEFCHKFLGCVKLDIAQEDEDAPCESDDDCDSGEHCWEGKCWDGGECEDGDHDDCGGDEACAPNSIEGSLDACVEVDGDIDGDDRGFCPYDEYRTGDWECPDSGDFCHEVVGCIDEEPCDEDNPCDDGFCWRGGCVDDTDLTCEFEGDAGWDFVDGEDGEKIELFGQDCEDFTIESTYDTVRVQRACICLDDEGNPVEEGAPCAWQNPPADGQNASCATAGSVRCDDGYMTCDLGDNPYLGDDEEFLLDQWLDDPDNPDSEGDMDEDDWVDFSDWAEGQLAGECDFSCDEIFENIEGSCVPGCDDNYYWTPDGTVFCGGEQVPIEEQGDDRCSSILIGEGADDDVGEFNCPGPGQSTDPEEDCAMAEDVDGNLRPMPEICDGLDNSCDGETDNIVRSWQQFRDQEGPWEPGSEHWSEEDAQQFENAGYYDMFGDIIDEFVDGDFYEAAACFEEPLCVSHMCDEGDMIHHMPDSPDVTYEEEFEAYIKGYTGGFDGCQCSPD